MRGGSQPGWALKRHWGLDPKVTFLNHGSFGACPTAVLEEQSRLRAEMEAEPIRFLFREIEDRLDAARASLAAFVGADADDLAFVTNATAGINAVLRWLRFEPGDELLVTDHEYNASRNALEVAAERAGARVVVARVPFPLKGPGDVAEAVLAACTPKTRLALIDHVTSQTGLVLPVETLVPELQRRGVLVLVDGAHAPGMLPLELGRLGADFYTGNCHKWICAPKGAAFLWARRDRQELVRPLAISHGANSPRTDRSRFRIEADWTGTCDPTPWLCVPAAIDFMGRLLPGGWDELRARNRELALEGRRLLCGVLGIPEPAPASMIGSLASVPLPDGSVRPVAPLFVDQLQDALWARDIEVPVVHWPAWPRRLLRIAPQAYNDSADVERLASALRDALRLTRPTS